MHHLAIETPLLHTRLQFLTWSKVAGNAHGLTLFGQHYRVPAAERIERADVVQQTHAAGEALLLAFQNMALGALQPGEQVIEREPLLLQVFAGTDLVQAAAIVVEPLAGMCQVYPHGTTQTHFQLIEFLRSGLQYLSRVLQA